jgi:hypothetical protein
MSRPAKRPFPLRIARRAGITWCRLTASRRLLPGFIIIGAQKAGTTSLFYYLQQHPTVLTNLRDKEVHFFDRRYAGGERGYRSFFPLKSRLPEGGVVGEDSPSYMFYPHIPRRIAAMVPDVKLIAVLRDPVRRALSEYNMLVRKGREDLSFEEALRLEDERTRDEWERLRADECIPYRTLHRVDRFSYKARGRYAEQLRRYFEIFDRSRLLILSSDDLAARTAEALGDVCRFLGIPPLPAAVDLSRRNVGASQGEYRSASPEVIEGLRDYFRPYNQELYELLGRDFGWG